MSDGSRAFRRRIAVLAAAAAAGMVAAVAVDYRGHLDAQEARIARDGRIVVTGRGRVEIADDGDGPPVLMLHGSPGGFDSGPLFTRLLGLTGHRVISPSRPGYLHTPAGSGRTPQQQADLMASLLDTLGVQRAVVVGISGGGPCALAMAQRHPHRCSRLVMIEAVSAEYSEQAMYAALSLRERIGKRLETAAMKANLPGYLLTRLARFEKSGMLTRLGDAFARYDLRRAGYELDMEQFGRLEPMAVANVTMPTLIVHGSEDTDVPVGQARELAARIPQSQLMVIDGMNHLSLWASPQLVPRVAAFIGSARGAHRTA